MNPPSDSLIDRRGWVKRFVLGTVASLSAPRWVATVLADPGDPVPGPAVLRLKIADYPALAAPGGSVQLVFNEIIKPFTLNRVSEDRFVTLDSICTHAGCTVGRFIVADNRMRCPCHGSRYDIEGRVFRDTNGDSTEPAQRDLNRFETSFDPENKMVSITIPGLVLGIHSLTVHQAAEDGTLRLKLRFPVTAFAKYEIRHQTALDGPFSVVPFATTPTGPANQTMLAPDFDGSATAYVDATGSLGFYVVTLKLLPL